MLSPNAPVLPFVIWQERMQRLNAYLEECDRRAGDAVQVTHHRRV